MTSGAKLAFFGDRSTSADSLGEDKTAVCARFIILTAFALSRILLVGDPEGSSADKVALKRDGSLLVCLFAENSAVVDLDGGSKDARTGVAEAGLCAPGFSEPGEERPAKDAVSLAGESLARGADSGLFPFCRAMARVKAPPLRAPAGDACPRRIV